MTREQLQILVESLHLTVRFLAVKDQLDTPTGLLDGLETLKGQDSCTQVMRMLPQIRQHIEFLDKIVK